ncbi:MAG: acylneuraminate cytidylyltransferase family protein [Gammaproteobacteria bacterium]|jgi:N,N'-diacetyl-8-epilegionaminate cytidylyltransferase|nr:acylneuraminate cytidylyltransferase family protein [Gammaproteobacteria bacterium]MBT7237172.1 acylneuraminate cytidylyltransferase family protein [Gammaproteobacteria bacterium]|tara:strand:+ start:408 stop:1103 length:696 start_codon:yes stop_codon:yes gene_type:complete
MKKVAFIFARGGSKGLPGKNMKLFSGKPLIAHTIIKAIESNLFSDIVVSTDCEEIAKTSLEYGASVPFMRPSNLAGDTTDEWICWQHAVKNYLKDIDLFITLPCTSPLRNYKTIEKMIDCYTSNNFDAVLGITKSNHSPNFNIVVKNDEGIVQIMNQSKKQINRRQDAEECYMITTYAYITSPDYITSSNSLFDGKIRGFEVPRDESVDIDDQYDFDIASYMYSKNNEYKN